ncbi:MAG: CHAT domain-containing protein [Pseudomonadales bacterium]|nr:CHAT domain-containing protein [Pseudomonadales bacterium]MBO7007325.1 CHAT domain-containing protein [Pseudomonadales bacterium]
MFRKLTVFFLLLLLSTWYLPNVSASDLHDTAQQAMVDGDIEGALSAYVDVLAKNPDDSEALEVAVLLAEQLGVNDLAMQLIAADVERAVELGNITRIQASLKLLGEASATLPAWVDEKLKAASVVESPQEADAQAWQELMGEAQQAMQLGDLETATMLLEGAVLLSQEAFGPNHWFTAVSMREMGLAFRQLGDAETADSFYGEAFGVSAELLGEGHPQTLYISALIAELYEAAGAYPEAIGMKEMNVALFEQSLGANHALTLEAMVRLAESMQAAADNVAATAMMSQACASYANALTQYHPKTLQCEQWLARLHRDTGSLNDAQATIDRISENLRLSSNGISEFALRNMLDLADVYIARGELQQAKDMLSGLILTARQIGSTKLSYTGKTYLARILSSEGDGDSATSVAEDVINHGRVAWQSNPIEFYNVLVELGAYYQRQSRFDEAEDAFQETLNAMLELGGELHPTTLVALNNLGNLYEQMGLYDEAEPLLKQTLGGMEQTFGLSHPQTSRTRNNLALLHESQGNFREAEPLYLTSYQHLSSSLGENHIDAIGMQNNLAYLYMLMEKYDSAAEMFEQLVERWSITAGPEHQDALKSLNNLGRVYHKQGRLDEARQTVSQALASRRSTLGDKHIDTVRSLIDMGVISLDQGLLDDAARDLELALKTAEEVIGDQHPYTFEALNNLAKVREAKNQLAAAVSLRELGLERRSQFLDRMLWVTGENAREGYMRLHRPELDDYLRLLASVDDPERGKKAIEVSLQRKGLLLKITSEIEQISQMSKEPRIALIAASLEEARKDLASLTLSGPTAETQGRHSEALYDLELRVNELQGELGRASARYRSSIAGTNADTLEDALPDNTALVDYLMYSDNGEGKALASVMIKKDGEVTYELVRFPDSAQMTLAIQEYRELIQDDLADEDELLEVGMVAHELVWLPIEDVIGDLEYVYLIPDGVLNILPFNALVNEDEEYLVQTTDLHILTSGRDLLPNEYELARGDYMILAGPDYDADGVVDESQIAAAEGRRSAALKVGIRGAGSGLRGLNFAPLPGAEEEGRVITDRVDEGGAGDQTEVYFGNDAQEQVLASMSSTPEVLHVATHGFFLEADESLRKRLLKMQRSAEIQVPPPGDNPLLRAGLAFAGINTNAQFLGDIDTMNDGVLTALEVLGLDLSGTRLVVLSACETGLGEIHEGEGVYGLRRSFQEAGVAEVVSSLWEVSDAGTQAMMTDFYDRIVAGIPAREALRETQLALIDSPEWGYPYIWSAFMIVGSYESAGIAIQ